MSALKSLDESIAWFFSHAGSCTTRSQCDAFASDNFGGPIEPIVTQGCFSYSVSAANGTTLVQFRDPKSPIDVPMLYEARSVHPDFVIGCTYLGSIGSEPGLLMYSMKMIPGDIYFNISLSLDEQNLDHQLATVRSLARYFAQSWNSGKSLELSLPTNTFQEYSFSFEHLIGDYLVVGSLPTTFLATVDHVRLHLSELFSGTYPLVVTHGDLSEMNILADPKTGEITGIIDWAEAKVEPFGFTLYAVDHALGCMTTAGWVPRINAKILRDEFWEVFDKKAGGVSESEMKLIKVARTAGLLLRYGTTSQLARKQLEALIPLPSSTHGNTTDESVAASLGVEDEVLDDGDANHATA